MTSTNDPLSLAQEIRKRIVTLSEDDPIQQCGPAPLQIIERRPDDVLALAHEKLHTWKYSDVSISWRRLYEDASLWKAIQLLSYVSKSDDDRNLKRKRSRSLPANRESSDSGVAHPKFVTSDWITSVVYFLDMAVILTAAPRRRDLINRVLDLLSAFVKPLGDAPAGAFPSAPTIALQGDTIARRTKLDFIAFQHHVDENRSPLIMSDVISDWPAIADPKHLWSDPLYLLRSTLGGRRLVPVELGRSYTDEGWSQKIMTFGEYLRTYLLQPKQKQTGYLAQHDLFDQIPNLAADTRTPDYCYTSPPPPDASYTSTVPVDALDEPLRNAWLGPAGTISPMHTDPYHNILCQVAGHKYIRLYPPSETHNLYPRGIDEAGVNMENTSHVDISLARKLFELPYFKSKEDLEEERADFERRFPKFNDARYIEGILRPGECLYIPVGWWHYIESLSTSFSMSFWWN